MPLDDRFRRAAEERNAHKRKMARKHEVESNPKLDRCYDLAWEHGHSSGLNEVEMYFDDFVELIK